MDHDFGGYATKANVTCTDGLVIMPGAFQHMDGKRVPLVWMHGHKETTNVLGHAILEHRDDGVYANCFFNNTKSGTHAKELVLHKDLDSLSIYADRVQKQGTQVRHGNIKEVSLVLAGANPGARIDYVRIQHSDGFVEELEDSVLMYFGEPIEHADSTSKSSPAKKTYQDVYDTLDADQVGLVEFMVKSALENSTIKQSDEDDKNDPQEESEENSDADDALEHQEGTDKVARNVFEKNGTDVKHSDDGAGTTITHAQIATLFDAAKKVGSLQEVLQHAEGDYGITNIEVLFPDAKTLNDKPEWITRRMEWVEGVLNGTRKVPFSRIKSQSADLTHEEARAKGYIKGTMKKEQFFEIKGRETTPKTIYKKQKLDRDDIVDITNFDVVAWIWGEMYFMLREESARAIMVGDGREVDDPDKIDETKIRPIAHDDEFYTDVVTVPANIDIGLSLVETVLRARDKYKGTGPTAYVTNAVLTDMLLAKDKMGRRLYNTEAELASALRVSAIVELPVLEGVKRGGGDVLMILVNLADYAVGSTQGGEITRFDQFDIDFNQYKYLIEGRFSGALQHHKRAQVIVRGSGTLVTPTVPTYNASTGVVTIPSATGVTYKNQDTGATLSSGAQTAIPAGEELSVVATPNTGYYFPHNTDADWTFVRPA